MKKEDLVNKLEALVGGMREELSKNEGSTLQTISASMKAGYDGVKSAISGNAKAQKLLDGMKGNFDELAKTVKAGDRKLSAKTLDALEKLIREYREKNAGEKPGPEESTTVDANLPMLEPDPRETALVETPENKDCSEGERRR